MLIIKLVGEVAVGVVDRRGSEATDWAKVGVGSVP